MRQDLRLTNGPKSWGLNCQKTPTRWIQARAALRPTSRRRRPKAAPLKQKKNSIQTPKRKKDVASIATNKVICPKIVPNQRRTKAKLPSKHASQKPKKVLPKKMRLKRQKTKKCEMPEPLWVKPRLGRQRKRCPLSRGSKT